MAQVHILIPDSFVQVVFCLLALDAEQQTDNSSQAAEIQGKFVLLSGLSKTFFYLFFGKLYQLLWLWVDGPYIDLVKKLIVLRQEPFLDVFI